MSSIDKLLVQGVEAISKLCMCILNMYGKCNDTINKFIIPMSHKVQTSVHNTGVRSFGPADDQKAVIKFDTPLTIITGQNGAGKTVR